MKKKFYITFEFIIQRSISQKACGESSLLAASGRRNCIYLGEGKMQNCGPLSQWVNLRNTPTPKAQETLLKRVWKDDCKMLRSSDFAVRVHLLVTWEATSIKPDKHDWTNKNWTRMTMVDMPNMAEKIPQGLSLTQRDIGDWKAGKRRDSSP